MTWPTKKLGEIVEGFKGQSVKRKDDGNLILIPSGAVFPDRLEDKRFAKISSTEVKDRKKYFKKGDVLFNTGGVGTLGRVGFFNLQINAVPDSFIFILRAKKCLIPKFLFYCLQTTKAKEYVIKFTHGTTGITSIYPRDLLNFEISLPPLKIQKRIVARIEELFEKIDKAKELRQKAKEKTEQVLQSALQEVFSKAEKKWGASKVLEISEKRPQYGYTESAKEVAVGPKFLRITDIQNGRVNWNKVPYCKCSDKDFEKYKLEKDDILFARTGATTGKTYLIKECSAKAIFASYLIRLKVNKDKTLADYVYTFFQSPQYWRQVIPYGGAQPNMNAQVLSRIQIPLPPLSEQKKIVAELDNLREKVEKLKQIQQKQLTELTELKQSILSKAFKGEL